MAYSANLAAPGIAAASAPTGGATGQVVVMGVPILIIMRSSLAGPGLLGAACRPPGVLRCRYDGIRGPSLGGS